MSADMNWRDDTLLWPVAWGPEPLCGDDPCDDRDDQAMFALLREHRRNRMRNMFTFYSEEHGRHRIMTNGTIVPWPRKGVDQ